MDFAEVREMLAGSSDEEIMTVVSALPSVAARMKAACTMLSEAADVFGLLQPWLHALPEDRWERQLFEICASMSDAEVEQRAREAGALEAQQATLSAVMRRRHLAAALVTTSAAELGEGEEIDGEGGEEGDDDGEEADDEADDEDESSPAQAAFAAVRGRLQAGGHRLVMLEAPFAPGEGAESVSVESVLAKDHLLLPAAVGTCSMSKGMLALALRLGGASSVGTPTAPAGEEEEAEALAELWFDYLVPAAAEASESAAAARWQVSAPPPSRPQRAGPLRGLRAAKPPPTGAAAPLAGAEDRRVTAVWPPRNRSNPSPCSWASSSSAASPPTPPIVTCPRRLRTASEPDACQTNVYAYACPPRARRVPATKPSLSFARPPPQPLVWALLRQPLLRVEGDARPGRRRARTRARVRKGGRLPRRRASNARRVAAPHQRLPRAAA